MCITWQRQYDLKATTVIATSIFFSEWGDSMWTFAIGLYLIKLTPGSLKLAAIYGLIVTLSAFIFVPLLETWLLNKNRLKVVRSLLILQNAFIVVAGLIISIHLFNMSSSRSILLMMQIFIIIFGTIANMAGQATKTCLTKDWVVVVCSHDVNKLAKMTALLRQINLSVVIIAPVIIGFLMSVISDVAGIVFICLWNFLTIVVGYILLARVYYGDVELQSMPTGGDIPVRSRDDVLAKDNEAFEPSNELETKDSVLNDVTKTSSENSNTADESVESGVTAAAEEYVASSVKAPEESSTENVNEANEENFSGEDPSNSRIIADGIEAALERTTTINTDEICQEVKSPTDEPIKNEFIGTNDINITVELDLSSDKDVKKSEEPPIDNIEAKEKSDDTATEMIVEENQQNNSEENHNDSNTAGPSNGDIDPTYNDAHLNPIDFNETLRAFENRCRLFVTGTANRLSRIKCKINTCTTNWKIYLRQPVFLAGLALSTLYVTVLGFNIITFSFAYSQGLAEVYVAICFGFGSLFGVAGTILYPNIQKRIGLFRTGLFGNVLFLVFLIICVISIWLPGSSSDLLSKDILITKNIAVMQNETMLTSIQTTTTNNSNTGNISIIFLMVGIILSRTGLWITDLSIRQIQHNYVKEGERVIIRERQYVLNHLFHLVTFILVILLPYPRQFGVLILLSTMACMVSFSLYSWFCCTVDRKLREDNFTQTVEEREEKIQRRYSC